MLAPTAEKRTRAPKRPRPAPYTQAEVDALWEAYGDQFVALATALYRRHQANPFPLVAASPDAKAVAGKRGPGRGGKRS